MKQNCTILVVLGIFAVLALVISACGPADTGPITLNLTGLVDNPLALTDAGLHKMDAFTRNVEHPKSGMTDYTGVLFNALLDEAGIQDDATTMVLTASDGYSAEVELAAVRECADCMLSFGETAGDYMAVMPGQSSKAWVKGLVSIEIK